MRSCGSGEPPSETGLLQAMKGHLEELLPVVTTMASSAVGRMLVAVRQEAGSAQVGLLSYENFFFYAENGL